MSKVTHVGLIVAVMLMVMWVGPATADDVDATGLEVLTPEEMESVQGGGYACNSALTDCTEQLGMGCHDTGEQCVWICMTAQYKVCISWTGSCTNAMSGTCCAKKYCSYWDGQCTEKYACQTGRGCTSPAPCSEGWIGCGFMQTGTCPQS